MRDRPSLAPGGRRNFGEQIAQLRDLLDLLLACESMGDDGSPLPSAPGVYLFSEGHRALYVGQTRKLRLRMRNHRNASSDHNQASFAFLLARSLVVEQDRVFNLERTRAQLRDDPVFAAAFDRAKTMVRLMALRFVTIENAVLRTLFEVYAAVALGTPHNSFETH